MVEKENDNTKIVLECDCHSHAVEFQIFEDEPSSMYQGLWMVTPSEDDIWHRIKAAWKVLTKGEGCLFEVVWRKEQMKELKDWLSNNIK